MSSVFSHQIPTWFPTCQHCILQPCDFLTNSWIYRSHLLHAVAFAKESFLFSVWGNPALSSLSHPLNPRVNQSWSCCPHDILSMSLSCHLSTASIFPIYMSVFLSLYYSLRHSINYCVEFSIKIVWWIFVRIMSSLEKERMRATLLSKSEPITESDTDDVQ